MSDIIIKQQSLVLIIDDSIETIRLLSSMLNEYGEIIFATSGEEGVRLAMQHQPDLILLDVAMPSMTGYEVCHQLKNNADTQHSSIIFVTAQADLQSESTALESGAVDFISKPFSPLVVRARVKTHLRLQRHMKALVLLANKDGLTDLYNRRYFDDQLEKEFQRHRRQKLPLGLAFIDIDHFKKYNDNYGHQKGDECLIRVARAINFATRRPGDIVARYGGEEFVVILPYTSIEDAEKYGEWICNNIRDLNIPHAYSPTASYLTISVGLTSKIPTDDISARQFVKLADEALYKAKLGGRNKSVVVSDASII